MHENFNVTVLRAATVYDPQWLDPCTFVPGLLLPDEQNCARPGLWVDLMMFILNLHGVRAKIRLVQVSSWSWFHGNSNGTSILNMLLTDQADITFPFTALTSHRSKYLPYGSNYQPIHVAFIYRKVSGGNPKLNKEFYQNATILFGAIWLVLYLIRMLARVLISRTSKKDNYWITTLHKRIKLVLMLALAIWLGCFSSVVVMVFNLPAEKLVKPFGNVQELVESLESGEYKATATSGSTVDHLLMPLKHRSEAAILDRFYTVSKWNPPQIVKTVDEAMNLVLNSTSTKYVFVVDSEYMPIIERSYCGFNYDIDEQFSFAFYTYFVTPRLRQLTELTGDQREKIRKAFKMLQIKYSFKMTCSQGYGYTPKDRFSISIWQIQGAFWPLILVEMLASICFLCEIVSTVLCKAKQSVGTSQREEGKDEQDIPRKVSFEHFS